jgi:hypothetical protein
MHLPEHYEFFCPVKINSGNRALEQTPFELDALNARKPLVIARKDDSERGLVDVIVDAFKDSGIAVGIFDGVPVAPDLKLIRELFNIYRGGYGKGAEHCRLRQTGKYRGIRRREYDQKNSEASNHRANLDGDWL